MSEPSQAVLFDLATLGVVKGSPSSGGFERLDAYPHVHEVLEQLTADGVRLGATTAREDVTEQQMQQLLQQSGLSQSVDLIVIGSDRFVRAISDAASQCVFVGEDRDERNAAREAGLRVAPHARFAAAALRGERLRYVRVTVPAEHAGDDWRQAVGGLDVVPLRVDGDHGTVVYAIATSTAATQLDDLGFEVFRLGGDDEPLTTEVYLLRDDRQTRTGFLVPEGASNAQFSADDESSRILASTRQGLYVALRAGRSVEGYHFAEARHGHTEKLLPDLSLLQPFAVREPARMAPAEEPRLSEDEQRAFGEITPQRIAADLARYTGTQPVDDQGTRIRSRHIFHADNAVGVQALVRDLQTVGYGCFKVRVHPFVHEGRALDNVEAELAGQELDELVLVTAHLDSTAAFSAGYDPVRDPAPGADDDGSGMVGVLAIAHTIAALSATKRPKRSIRLVLFNAEEHGLVGSKAYARDQAALAAPIIAVFQTDMIGYNREAPRTFEVHAGFLPSADVQERSRVLAQRIVRTAQQVSPDLPAAQIYLSTGPLERDPAEGRSDHSSFQRVGYPACAATEDFFAGPQPGSAPEPNPNYHTTSDTFVDVDYAADIVRAVGAAAWVTANL
jgi:bacterial leucyl aminopeptidase